MKTILHSHLFITLLFEQYALSMTSQRAVIQYSAGLIHLLAMHYCYDGLATPLLCKPARCVDDQRWHSWDQNPDGCKQRAKYAAFWRSYHYCVCCPKKFVIVYHRSECPLRTRWDKRHSFGYECQVWNAWFGFGIRLKTELWMHCKRYYFPHMSSL